MTGTDAHRAIDAVWRIEQPRLIAGLARMVRDVGLAEELAQDALVAALERWPVSRVPDKPGARARTAAETDWGRIAVLYEALARLAPSPVVELNRAVALAMVFGPAAGLELVDSLTAEPALKGYHLLPSVRGDLLARLGRDEEARAEFQRAASLTRNAREREMRLRRAAGAPGSAPPKQA